MRRPDQHPRWIKAFGYAAALLSGLLMGISWVILKLALNFEVLGPADLNWLNMVGLAIIIWPVYLIRRRRDLFPRDMPYRWLLVFALFAATLFYLRNTGVGICGATTAAIVSRVETTFVFILSYLVLHQAVGGLGWVGSLLLLAGALRTVGLGSAQMNLDLLGVGALVIGALFVALNAVIIKTHFNRVPNELVILASATVQTVVYSMAVPAFIGLDGVRAALAEPRLLGLVALMSVIIAGNLFAYYYAMKRVPMWAARMLALLAPAVAVVADYAILGTPITANAVQGLLLVMGGATLVILSSRGDNGAQRAVARERVEERSERDG